jgi:hypothetical protein
MADTPGEPIEPRYDNYIKLPRPASLISRQVPAGYPWSADAFVPYSITSRPLRSAYSRNATPGYPSSGLCPLVETLI